MQLYGVYIPDDSERKSQQTFAFKDLFTFYIDVMEWRQTIYLYPAYILHIIVAQLLKRSSSVQTVSGI